MTDYQFSFYSGISEYKEWVADLRFEFILVSKENISNLSWVESMFNVHA